MAAVRTEWFVVGAVVVVVAVALGLRFVGSQGAGVEPSGRGGSARDAASASVADAQPQARATVTDSSVAESRAAAQAATVEPRQAARAEAPSALSASGRMTRYVVQPGDSLNSIAARNHLTPATLASVNELEDPDLLQPGRELIIPSTDGFVHVVEPGETLRSIADRYGSQTAALIDANVLSAPDNLPAGLRLFIPRDAALTADRGR